MINTSSPVQSGIINISDITAIQTVYNYSKTSSNNVTPVTTLPSSHVITITVIVVPLISVCMIVTISALILLGGFYIACSNRKKNTLGMQLSSGNFLSLTSVVRNVNILPAKYNENPIYEGTDNRPYDIVKHTVNLETLDYSEYPVYDEIKAVTSNTQYVSSSTQDKVCNKKCNI